MNWVSIMWGQCCWKVMHTIIFEVALVTHLDVWWCLMIRHANCGTIDFERVRFCNTFCHRYVHRVRVKTTFICHHSSLSHNYEIENYEKSFVLCSLSTVSSSVSLNEVFSLTVHVFTWFERVSIMVILLNCVTLGMYQPCENIDCSSDRCQILQVDANTHIHTVFFFFVNILLPLLPLRFTGASHKMYQKPNKKNHQLLSILQFCLLYSEHHSFTEPLVWLETLPFLFSSPLFFFFLTVLYK